MPMNSSGSEVDRAGKALEEYKFKSAQREETAAAGCKWKYQVRYVPVAVEREFCISQPSLRQKFLR